MNKIKILIADDHPIFRYGVADVINKSNELELVAQAEDGMQAYQLILELRPDIAVLDLEMPMLSGMDVAKKVLHEKHSTEFIILTMHKERNYVMDAFENGVKGFLLKDNAVEDLVKCIREVYKGNRYASNSLKHFIDEMNKKDSLSDVELQAKLTATEQVILKLIGEGKTSNEIAALLFISPNTVDNHRSNMTKKLALEGKNSLLKYAMKMQ
jgi:DNA-binding NarL/FixJ family response regulator